MKKRLEAVRNILSWTLTAAAAVMIIFTIVSLTAADREDRSIFGFRAFIALSDSMSATDFDAGDLVLVKEVDPATLKEGDIIAYMDTVLEEKKLNMVFMMLTDILEETTYMVCAGEGADQVMEAGYHEKKTNDSYTLKGVVSRKKQVIPVFMTAIQ